MLLLAGHFLELNRARLGARSLRLAADAEEALCQYHWPGNIRELEHVISRAALKAISRGADRRDIITLQASLLDLDTVPSANAEADTTIPVSAMSTGLPLKMQVEILQRRAIEQALEQHDYNQAAAARALALDPSNLRKLMQRLNIHPNKD